MHGRILIVDDDPALRTPLRERLEHWGLDVDEAADGSEALEATARHEYDVALLDLSMPGLGGLEVLRRWRAEGTTCAVIVLTAHGSIERAVEAIKQGAADFLQKPTDFELLRARLEGLLEARRHRRHLQVFVDRADDEATAPTARSSAMVQLLERARRAAASDATVLLTGESGTGKQVMAEFLHANSERRDGPFVYVNCVALSDELVESTLFGHERGAFTGAVARKEGRIELAAGGTAFLDEIGDTTLRLQAKLLHFLETGEFERVGGTKTLCADCRIVAATNRDLQQAIGQDRFRKDLFYRLNVIPLHVPPLRERPEDVPLLAEAFARRFAREQKLGPVAFADETLERLQTWTWPGNVRELKNLVERMVVLASGEELTPDLLPDELFRPAVDVAPQVGRMTYKEAVAAFKRSFLAEALARAQGNQTRAAEMLGMQRTFLSRLLKDFGLRADPPSDTPPG